MLVVLSPLASAQPGTALMQSNDVVVRLNSRGLISDSLNSPAMRTATGLRLLDKAGVWMSGTDANGRIRVSAHSVTGRSNDFWPGPLQLSNEVAADSVAWNKVWALNREEVAYHKAHYKDNNYTASDVINEWPGNGPAGYAKILAPFVDNELNDQDYQSKDGDYPYFSQESYMYSISNDNASDHVLSGALPLGVELHTSVLGFSDADPDLRKCVMVRYSVFNRSARDYKDFRLSAVLNFGIGAQENEYLGTDVNNKILFAINDTSEATFSGKLVSTGCMALNHQLSSTMYFENTSDPVNGLPAVDSHYVRLMSGHWKNNKQLVYGGNGVDASGAPARFVYPYNTDASHGSLMWSDNERYQPGKRFGLMNFDSVELKAGTARNYDLLYFFVEEDSFDIKQIGQSCLNIKRVLNTKNLLKTAQNGLEKANNIVLYPNPVKAGEKMVIKFTHESPLSMRIISVEGIEIVKINLDSFDNSIILPEDLAEGVYLLEYETLNTKRHIKFNLNH